LLGAVRDGVALLTWEQDTFAFADSFDETASRYRGLRGGQAIALADAGAPGLLVKPVIARRQLDAEQTKAPAGPTPSGPAVGTGGTIATDPAPGPAGAPAPVAAQPKRFHGTVTLDTTRVGRDASRVADEVIAHLSGLVGAKVKVS
jgi:hypothetical protein